MLFTKFRMVDKAKQLFLGRDSQFVVDVARMGAHRGLRDVKALGNVGVAVAAPEECEQLSLSRSEAVCGSQLVAAGLDERFEEVACLGGGSAIFRTAPREKEDDRTHVENEHYHRHDISALTERLKSEGSENGKRRHQSKAGTEDHLTENPLVREPRSSSAQVQNTMQIEPPF